MITIVMVPPRKTIQVHLCITEHKNIVESTNADDQIPLNPLFDQRISAVLNASPAQSSGNSGLAPEMLVAGALKFVLVFSWCSICSFCSPCCTHRECDIGVGLNISPCIEMLFDNLWFLTHTIGTKWLGNQFELIFQLHSLWKSFFLLIWRNVQIPLASR
jgi:hypothetical protein